MPETSDDAVFRAACQELSNSMLAEMDDFDQGFFENVDDPVVPVVPVGLERLPIAQLEGPIESDKGAQGSTVQYQEPMLEQSPAAVSNKAQSPTSADAELWAEAMQAQQAPVPLAHSEHLSSGTLSYECSLQREQDLYNNYAPHRRVCITLSLLREVECVTVIIEGAHKRENGTIAHEQRLVFSRRQGSKFVVDDRTDQAHFKMSACSVENRGGKVFIELALDRSHIKLFTSIDRRDRPSESLDNTFSITVLCTLSDGTSTSTFIEPRMRILSRLSGGKRECDLPEEYRRNSKAAKIDFEQARAAARKLDEPCTQRN